jgi:hypothetical protein
LKAIQLKVNVIILLPSVFCVLNIEVSDEKNDAGTGAPEKGCLNR